MTETEPGHDPKHDGRGPWWAVVARYTPGIAAAVLLWFALDRVLTNYAECVGHLAGR